MASMVTNLVLITRGRDSKATMYYLVILPFLRSPREGPYKISAAQKVLFVSPLCLHALTPSEVVLI